MRGEKQGTRGRVNRQETGENNTPSSKREMPDNLGGLNNHNLKQIVDRHRREVKASVDKIKDAGKPVPERLEKALENLEQ